MKFNKRGIMRGMCVVSMGLIFTAMFLNGLNKELALADQEPQAEVEQVKEVKVEEPKVEEVKPVVDEVPTQGTYAYYCYKIKIAALERGIDYKLAVAVARLETGNFKSSAFVKGHNWGGIGSHGPKKYENEEVGFEAYMKLIGNYYKKYGDDIESMAKRYCPGNATKWAKAVRNIMKEVK